VDGTDESITKTAFFCDGSHRYCEPALFFDGDALDEYYKFRTWGNLMFCSYLNSLVQIWNCSHNCNLFIANTKDIFHFACCQGENVDPHFFYKKKTLKINAQF
jgi:hypothetical protein